MSIFRVGIFFILNCDPNKAQAFGTTGNLTDNTQGFMNLRPERDGGESKPPSLGQFLRVNSNWQLVLVASCLISLGTFHVGYFIQLLFDFSYAWSVLRTHFWFVGLLYDLKDNACDYCHRFGGWLPAYAPFESGTSFGGQGATKQGIGCCNVPGCYIATQN